MIAIIFVAELLLTINLLAQDAEESRIGTITITQLTVLRDQPSSTARVIQILRPGTTLLWVDGQRVNGFWRVIVMKGPRGWVPDSKAQVVKPPNLLAAAGACQPDLASCPATGCADPDTAQGIFNRTKRRIPTATTPVTLNFEDFALLQEQANTLVGQGSDLSAEERALLTNLAISGGATVQEGSLVRLTGFIANGMGAKPPHANTGESVNCGLTQTKNNDFHISLTAAASNTEFAGVVVEIAPQSRPTGWTLPKLTSVKTMKRRVMVVGALFYDNKHVVNDDPAHPTSGDPKRFALWEVHPITKFFICRKTNNACNPDKASDWKPLEIF
jgi:hypothetical protein